MQTNNHPLDNNQAMIQQLYTTQILMHNCALLVMPTFTRWRPHTTELQPLKRKGIFTHPSSWYPLVVRMQTHKCHISNTGILPIHCRIAARCKPIKIIKPLIQCISISTFALRPFSVDILVNQRIAKVDSVTTMTIVAFISATFDLKENNFTVLKF